VPTAQPSLDQALVKKDSSFIQTTTNLNNNTNLNLPPEVKSVNIIPTNIAANMNISMANLNLPQGLAHMHNQLDNIIHTTASLTSIQNSHNVTMSSQQHSNGFPNTKRSNSPSNILNNNGMPGLNIGMNMGSMSSIFDPLPIVSNLPMQISQLSMKKEEKIPQSQLAQKPMDGSYFPSIFQICNRIMPIFLFKFSHILHRKFIFLIYTLYIYI